MSEKKYYCYCESNCKYETLTKEQILSAVEQARSGQVIDPNAAYITKVKESNGGGYVTFWVGTQVQFNALVEKDANCVYIVTDSTKDDDINNAIAVLQQDVSEKADLVAVEAAFVKKADTKPIVAEAEYVRDFKATCPHITELYEGLTVTIVPKSSCQYTNNVTFELNGLGALPIVRLTRNSDGGDGARAKDILQPYLMERNTAITLQYSNSEFNGFKYKNGCWIATDSPLMYVGDVEGAIQEICSGVIGVQQYVAEKAQYYTVTVESGVFLYTATVYFYTLGWERDADDVAYPDNIWLPFDGVRLLAHRKDNQVTFSIDNLDGGVASIRYVCAHKIVGI